MLLVFSIKYSEASTVGVKLLIYLVATNILFSTVSHNFDNKTQQQNGTLEPFVPRQSFRSLDSS